MARISGVELQDNWKVDYALTHIKGVGWSSARKVLADLKIDTTLRISDLSGEDVTKIAGKMDEFKIEGDLARWTRENIQRLRTIGSYRGMRHAKGLPVRGQRTKSNARTKRGKRRTVGAFKKDTLAKQTQAKKGEA